MIISPPILSFLVNLLPASFPWLSSKDHFLSPHDTLLMLIFILHSSGSPTQPITPQVIPLSNCIISSLSLLALFMTLYNFSLHLCISLSPQPSHFSAYPQFATVSTSVKHNSLPLLSSMPFHLASLTPNVCMRNNISQVCCCLSAPFSLKCASRYSAVNFAVVHCSITSTS